MEQERLGKAAINAFRYNYALLASGETGSIPETDIEPVSSLPDAELLDEYREAGRSALARLAVVKLNGGLGTGMGLERAKSLLTAKDGLTFLDILARQALALRKATGVPVPLLFMNSFSTHSDTLDALSIYPTLEVGLPLAFLQNKVPKVMQDGLRPPESGPADPQNWAPPGHGDLYAALQTSEMLPALRERGIRYLFVSNSDNLGATLDEGILGYFAKSGIPFLMEAADRTEAERRRTMRRFRMSSATASSTPTTYGSTSRLCSGIWTSRVEC
jgi:UTP--glucose-1-phosphate uridylyltransferase